MSDVREKSHTLAGINLVIFKQDMILILTGVNEASATYPLPLNLQSSVCSVTQF